MSKFKFYGIHDKTKEAIKVFSSKTLTEAYVIASKIKRVSSSLTSCPTAI